MVLEITREHVTQLVDFLESSPTDFNQGCIFNCTGAHLARIMGKEQRLDDNLYRAWYKQFPQYDYKNPKHWVFGTGFKDGDPALIAKSIRKKFPGWF